MCIGVKQGLSNRYNITLYTATKFIFLRIDYARLKKVNYCNHIIWFIIYK